MNEDIDGNIDEYATGFNDGWQECHKRILSILERFPLQTAAITLHLKYLHPSQPCVELGESEHGLQQNSSNRK